MMSWHEQCENYDSRVEASAKDVNFNDTEFLLIQADAEDPGGDKVSANKAILALISPVFYAQFYGPLSSNQPPPPIQDGTARGFKQFIKFICNPISFKFPENNVVEVFEISYFAHKYQIGSLVSQCRQQLDRFNVEGKELEVFNWALSTEQGLELKKTATPEYELLVNRCLTRIEENFENIFPNGKIKDGQELFDETLMLKILRKKELRTHEHFVLMVTLDYYSKIIGKKQIDSHGEKRLKLDSEDEWNEKLVEIKKFIKLDKVSPEKFSELVEKFSDVIPNKIICDITRSISKNWKGKNTFDNTTGKRSESDKVILINFDCEMRDFIHDDELASGAQITFKTNQNAILHIKPSIMMRTHFTMMCFKSICGKDEVECCARDRIILKIEGQYQDEILLKRNKDNTLTEQRFYVEANKNVTISFEKNCKRPCCALHLARTEKFHFSERDFALEVLEFNGQPVTSPCYSFLSLLLFKLL